MRKIDELIDEIESRYSPETRSKRDALYNRIQELPSSNALGLLNNILLGPGILREWGPQRENTRRILYRDRVKQLRALIEKWKRELVEEDAFFANIQVPEIPDPFKLYGEAPPRTFRSKEPRTLLIENLFLSLLDTDGDLTFMRTGSRMRLIEAARLITEIMWVFFEGPNPNEFVVDSNRQILNYLRKRRHKESSIR